MNLKEGEDVPEPIGRNANRFIIKISRTSPFIIIYFIPCHLPLRYGQSAHYISYLRTSDVKPVILRLQIYLKPQICRLLCTAAADESMSCRSHPSSQLIADTQIFIHFILAEHCIHVYQYHSISASFSLPRALVRREVRQEQGKERFVRLQNKCMRPCMMQPNETVAHHYSAEYLKMPTSIVLFKIVSSQTKNKHGNLTAVNWIASFIDT